MKYEQKEKYEHLKWRQERLAIGLQRIVDALANDAFARFLGIRPEVDESEKVAAYERTLARMDELLEEERKLLVEAGILNDDEHDARHAPTAAGS